MSMEENEARMIALQYASGAVLPMVLKAAVELDLFRLIENAARSVSASELAAQLPTSDPAGAAAKLDRVLRLLAAHSILSCSMRDGGGERRYSLAPVGKFFVENEDGASYCPLSLMNQDKVLMESWYHLKDAILEGGTPFNKAHGMSIFGYAAKDGRISKILNKTMSENSTILLKKVMETYKGFEGIQNLVDVGGGIGTSLNLIVSNYPSIKGINFDLPHVINQAPSYSGIEHVGGDMFVSVPKGDAIFIKSVLHNWSDAECVRILKNCKTALPHNGKVVIAEFVLSEIPNSGTLMGVHVEVADMFMLAYNPGAKERTEMEFRTLAKESGFQGFRKVCNVDGTWVMELYD